MKNPLLYTALLTTALFFSSCEEGNDPGPKIITENPGSVTSATIFSLPADPATSYTNTGTPLGTTGKFKFFNFSTGQTVPNSDSLTNKWDIGFRGTTIIVNGGANRIGSGGAKIISEIFDNLAEAPADGYSTDGAGSFAIPTGSGNGWYTYNAQAGTIIPTAGKILVIKTGEGKFAKMEILSYYKDAPASPTQQSPGRYYTFRYSFQPDGSRNFK
jgi:hypothetical protein